MSLFVNEDKGFILVFDSEVTKFNGTDLPKYSRIIFVDRLWKVKKTISSAEQVKFVKGQLLYVKNESDFYKYTLSNSKEELLFTIDGTVLSYDVRNDYEFLVHANETSNVNFPEAQSSVTLTADKLALYNHKTGEVINVSNENKITESFICGKYAVYLNGSVVRMRDLNSENVYTISGFNIARHGFSRGDSTFVFANEKSAKDGGGDYWTVVDTRKLGTESYMQDIFKVSGLGIPYPVNGEIMRSGWNAKNLLTGEDYSVPDGETWSLDIKDYSLSYIGEFKNPKNDGPIVFFWRDGDNLISFAWGDVLVKNLYRQTGSVTTRRVNGTAIAYPNPANGGQTSLQLEKPAQITVHSITGQVTHSQMVYPGVVQIPILPGINVVSIKYTDGLTETLKVIGQ